MFEDEVERARALREAAASADAERRSRTVALRAQWDDEVAVELPRFLTAVDTLRRFVPPELPLLGEWRGFHWDVHEPLLHTGTLTTPSGTTGRIWWRFDRPPPPLQWDPSDPPAQEWVHWLGWVVSMRAPWPATYREILAVDGGVAPGLVETAMHIPDTWGSDLGQLTVSAANELLPFSAVLATGPRVHQVASYAVLIDAVVVLRALTELVAALLVLASE